MDIFNRASDRYLAQIMELHLDYQAKNYAVNVMILRRLSLIFGRLQKQQVLTESEIQEISKHLEKIQVETENRATDDLRRRLREISQDVVDSVARDVSGEAAQ